MQSNSGKYITYNGNAYLIPDFNDCTSLEIQPLQQLRLDIQDVKFTFFNLMEVNQTQAYVLSAIDEGLVTAKDYEIWKEENTPKCAG